MPAQDHEAYFRAIKAETTGKTIPRDDQGKILPSAFAASVEARRATSNANGTKKPDNVIHLAPGV